MPDAHDVIDAPEDPADEPPSSPSAPSPAPDGGRTESASRRRDVRDAPDHRDAHDRNGRSILIIVDNPKRWPLHIPGIEVVAAREYLTDSKYAARSGVHVFNLCRSHRYQTTGYYVSLLATAREHRPLPTISTLQDLRLAPVLRVASNELDELIQSSLRTLRSDSFQLSVYFGRNVSPRYLRLSLALFNQFPAPLLRASFVRHQGAWELEGVRIIGTSEIPDEHRPFVVEQAEAYFRRPIRKRKPRAHPRFDMAILRDEHESMPPSDPEAIEKFVDAAESLGFRTELITRDDYGRLAEFDSLFIRETTRVNHHTFRFARRATAEGLVVVDDPDSILRCTNKVFLTELMTRHEIPIPRSLIVSRDTADLVGRSIGFPCVIKQPDSSFSLGVEKIDSAETFEQDLPRLFEQTELLLAQEFVPTDFDWRIGVLAGEPLFACRYYMARKHWQIYRHEGGRSESGTADTIPVEDAPPRVVSLAVRAARLIGTGLYGVDIKVIRNRPVIIEINDNPSIDADVEDRVLGDELYRRIIEYFVDRLEARRR